MTHRDPLSGLKAAIPYLQLWRGQIFVVKIGGEGLLSPAGIESFISQVAAVHFLGIKVVVVHGGGPQATALAAERGVENEVINGRRVTSQAMASVMEEALTSIRERLVAVATSHGLQAVGLSGHESGLVRAHRRPPGEIDLGWVGDIDAVNHQMVLDVLANEQVPMISSLCSDADGHLLNVNADTFASRLAVALGAQKLIMMTGAPGLLRDPQDPYSLISHLDIAELKKQEASGAIKDGMMPKAGAVVAALTHGVPRVHLIGHGVPDSLLIEVFTNEGSGTMVVAHAEELAAPEPVAAG